MQTILVVDDEPAIRRLAQVALEEAGFRVLQAASGSSALRLAEQDAPDLVLLDIALPGANGREVYRRLRAEPVTAGTPVLFLSGLPEDEPHGAVGTVRKPFGPSELLARVREALRRPATASI